MRDQILSKIEQRRARLLELERERLVLQGELSAYEDALRYFPSDNPQAVEKPATPTKVTNSNVDRVPVVRRRRRQSSYWKEALRRLSTTPLSTFDIDAIMRGVADLGMTPTRGNVRSQMAAYIDRGLVSRVSDGEFKLTDEGLSQIHSLASDKDEAADPTPSGESAASASDHNQHREGDAGGGI
jgi:hypothetical protein